ncbi:MAG: hypothetical protein ABS949_12040 [Solibacillus sp.]
MITIDALNIFYREDVISDFFKSCFEDSAPFLHQFLNCADISLPVGSKFTITNRLGLGKSIGTPDMIVVAENSQESHIIIVENKLGAAEGITQTQRYESSEARELIRNSLNLRDTLHFHFIYLTLDTTVAPSSTNFKNVYYEQFLTEGWALNDATLNMLFTDFKEKLNQFYTPLSQPLQTLFSEKILDSTQKKICWQSILFEKFNDSPQYELDWGEVGGSGRNNFLFLVTKPNWKATTSFKDTGLANTFYVHIDTYINLLTSKNDVINEIGIRFETYPYVPHKNINNVEGYTNFIANKAIFSERLFHRIFPLIEGVKRKNNKSLVITIPVNNENLTFSINDYKHKISIIENEIDFILNELKEEGILQKGVI